MWVERGRGIAWTRLLTVANDGKGLCAWRAKGKPLLRFGRVGRAALVGLGLGLRV